MTKFEVIPLTNELYKKFYHDKNHCFIQDDIIIQSEGDNEIIFALAEGLALMDGDKPVFISGVFFDDQNIYAASDYDISLDRKKYKKTIYKFAVKSMEIVKKYPAIVIADSQIEGSAKVLNKLGFLKISEGLHRCPP